MQWLGLFVFGYIAYRIGRRNTRPVREHYFLKGYQFGYRDGSHDAVKTLDKKFLESVHISEE